jgi:hypothetical protein
MGWKTWSKLALALIILAVVAFLIFTPGSLEHNGFRRNESAAAGGLRRINILERGYASAHPDKGFACDCVCFDQPSRSLIRTTPSKLFWVESGAGIDLLWLAVRVAQVKS